MEIDHILNVVFVIIFGIVIGSFLNVIIYRLPQMSEQTDKLSLKWTASHCVHCQKSINPWYNITSFSYLMLSGDCAECGRKISVQYLMIELITGLLYCAIYLKYDCAVKSLAIMTFTSFVIILSAIDFRHYILPDKLTFPLIWSGFLVNLSGTFIDVRSAVIGAVAGYLILWVVYHIYKLARTKDAMGCGDFKLLAAIGAWVGWQVLPTIILCASVTGLMYGLAHLVIGKGQKVAFGPHLAFAGWIAIYFDTGNEFGMLAGLN